MDSSESFPLVHVDAAGEPPLELATHRRMAAMLLKPALEAFDGWLAPGPGQPDSMEELKTLGEWIRETWTVDPSARIVLAGSGTAGRLAIYAAWRFNEILKRVGIGSRFDAVTRDTPREAFHPSGHAEDLADQDLIGLKGDRRWKSVGLVVGLACGPGSHFTASVLKVALENGARHAAYIEPRRSRDESAAILFTDGHTILELISGLRASERCLVLAPVVGPEMLRGFQWAKQGSASLAGLSAAFLSGLQATPPQESLRRLRRAVTETAATEAALGHLIRTVSSSLLAGEKIAFVGRQGAGILGAITAAEGISAFCDTPGSLRGYALLDATTESTGPETQVSARILPKDSISAAALRASLEQRESRPHLLLAIRPKGKVDEALESLCAAARVRGAVVENVSPPRIDPDSADFPEEAFLLELGWDLAAKTCLDIVSAGAHASIGRTCGNRIIEMRLEGPNGLSRAVGAVEKLTGAPRETARRFVLTAIYGGEFKDGDSADDDMRHIRAWSGRRGIVAESLLIASGLSPQEARAALAREPVVRKALLSSKRGDGVPTVLEPSW